MILEQNVLVNRIRNVFKEAVNGKIQQNEKDMAEYESIMVEAKSFAEIQVAYDMRQKLEEDNKWLTLMYQNTRMSASMADLCEALYGEILLKDNKTNQVPISLT